MIKSVSFTAITGARIAVTTDDGVVWHDDLSLPPDTDVRRRLAEWLEAGGVVAPYEPPPEPTPASISRRQFFQQAALAGLISQEEALAAVRSGTIPAPLQGAVNQLPAGEQFAAEMLISGAMTFELAHPLTTAIGAQLGVDVAAFFAAAAEL